MRRKRQQIKTHDLYVRRKRNGNFLFEIDLMTFDHWYIMIIVTRKSSIRLYFKTIIIYIYIFYEIKLIPLYQINNLRRAMINYIEVDTCMLSMGDTLYFLSFALSYCEILVSIVNVYMSLAIFRAWAVGWPVRRLSMHVIYIYTYE